MIGLVALCALAILAPTEGNPILGYPPLLAHPAPAAIVPLPLLHSIRSQYHSQDELGQYSYGYSNEHSSKVENKDWAGVTSGGYSYIDANGLVQAVNYVSDDVNGFRVAASNLPVAPPAPVVALPVAPQPIAVPAAPLPEPVQDTPEVQKAKEDHKKAFEDAEKALKEAEKQAAENPEEPAEEQPQEQQPAEETKSEGEAKPEEETKSEGESQPEAAAPEAPAAPEAAAPEKAAPEAPAAAPEAPAAPEAAEPQEAPADQPNDLTKSGAPVVPAGSPDSVAVNFGEQVSGAAPADSAPAQPVASPDIAAVRFGAQFPGAQPVAVPEGAQPLPVPLAFGAPAFVPNPIFRALPPYVGYVPQPYVALTKRDAPFDGEQRPYFSDNYETKSHYLPVSRRLVSSAKAPVHVSSGIVDGNDNDVVRR